MWNHLSGGAADALTGLGMQPYTANDPTLRFATLMRYLTDFQRHDRKHQAC